jgi:hypothetical protein
VGKVLDEPSMTLRQERERTDVQGCWERVHREFH